MLPDSKSACACWLCDCRAQLLGEYFDSLDAAEASRCLRGLAVPFFHHELVKQSLHAAMENPPHTEHVTALLKRWAGSKQAVAVSGRLCEHLTVLASVGIADRLGVCNNGAFHHAVCDSCTWYGTWR